METQTEEVRPLMESFVAEQEAVQADLKRRLWRPSQRRSEFERDIWTHYEWLQAWDLMSLFVCLRDLDRPGAEEGIGPVPVAISGVDVDISVRVIGDRTVTIDPYPFGVPTLDVGVPARIISDREYVNEDDLTRAMRAARQTVVDCRIVPG
jgi:hypothetical protein